MMKNIVCLLSFIFCLTVSANEIKFTAEVSPASLSKGESFYLTYTLNAAGTNMRLASMPDFELLTPQPDVNQNRFSTNINGTIQQTASYTYRYVLRAKNEGTFSIPPATISVGGKQYKSNPVTLQVGKQQKNSPSAEGYEDVFIRLVPSQTTVYEQEAFLLSYKIYTQQANFAGWNNITYPDTKGFIAQEIALNPNVQWISGKYNNREYQTALFKQQILQAQHAGTLTIGQGRFDAVLNIPVVMRGVTVNQLAVSKTLTSETLKINVKPLPAGKPASFNNAVGNFRITSEISPEELRVNEAFTLTLTISGNGNLRLFKNPEVNFPASFERFEPKSDTEVEVTAAGISGSRTIEFLAIPRQTGKFVIPSVVFGFFNPETGKYQTLKTPEYTIEVQGDANMSSNVNNPTNVEQNDTRHFGFWLLFIVLFLAVVSLFIYLKKRNDNVNTVEIRSKQASEQALEHLKTADKFRKENNEKAFCEELLKALWAYLSVKLNISLSELNKDNIEEKLRAVQTDELQIKQLMNTLQTAEMIRYAPTQTTGEMDRLYEQALEIMKN